MDNLFFLVFATSGFIFGFVVGFVWRGILQNRSTKKILQMRKKGNTPKGGLTAPY